MEILVTALSTFALWFAGGLVGIAILTLLVWAIALGLEDMVIHYLNVRLRPHEKVKTSPGIRLELVLTKSKPATVGWDMISATFNRLLVGMCIALGESAVPYFAIVFATLLDRKIPAAYAFLFGLIYGISFILTVWTLPFKYWTLEWERQNTRMVVTTADAIIRKAVLEAVSILGLFTEKGRKMIRWAESEGPTKLFEEIKLAADVQDINPKFQTSWLRDQWTIYLTGVYGVGSLFLPSRVIGAADYFEFLDWAKGTMRALIAIGKLGDARSNNKRVALEIAARAFIGDAQMEDWNETEAQRWADEVMRRFEIQQTHYTPPQEFDLYWVEDPGLWDRKNGVPVIEPVVAKPKVAPWMAN